jgi:signal transduction histidine kinase
MFPLIAAGITIYNHMVNTMKVSIFNKLEAIRDLKVDELNHWFVERIIDVHTVAADDDIRVLEKTLEGREGNNKPSIAVVSRARNLLSRYLQNYDDFHEIFIVDPHTKKILVSTDKKNEGKKRLTDHHFIESFQSGELFIDDIHYSARLNKPCMAFSIPIFSLTGGSRVIGILVASINLENSLYKLLLNRMGVGKTGETLIVNNDVIALNELRWHKNAVLKLKIESKPAVDASCGKTGIVETDDYRGEMVLAAYTHIPRTGWGFVAKQDLKEVYAPINKFRNRTSAFGIITLFIVIIAAFRVSKSISEPIKILHKGSEIIGSGNLDHIVGTDAKDEIGELSRTFDLMIEKLKTTTASWDELNKEITERKHLEKTLLEIEEHERRRIGHDLHDNLGQQLTGISFRTKGLENRLRKTSIPEAEDAARITNLIEMSKTQVKSLSIGLAPMFEKDEYSLVTAIVELASNSEKLFGIQCDVKCNKFVTLYNKAALINLYRIAQEAITNAARHAKPEKIEIRLSKKHNEITMTIRDDGGGFSMLNRTSGMGLEIMRYRAGIINASIDIHSDINKGTIVTCFFIDTKESEINFTGKVEV